MRFRRWFPLLGLALFAVATAGPLWVLAHSGGMLGHGEGYVEAVWGEAGVLDGYLFKPRALTIDDQDQIYVVDKTARIQVFTADGEYLRGWRTPAWALGKPTGLSVDRDGTILVADTHYHRILFYTRQGRLLADRTMGEPPTGSDVTDPKPGQFAWVSDVVRDSRGNLYVSEYGPADRIQKFSPQGEFLMQWGGHGDGPGQFARPQCLAIDRNDHLWVADACNHRVQVFDATGVEPRLVRMWGTPGSAPGQLRYPYSLLLDGNGHVYICEFGNHRVQKLTLDGQPIASWGRQGRGRGELFNPWAIARDSRGRIFVLDTYNHRVYRIRL